MERLLLIATAVIAFGAIQSCTSVQSPTTPEVILKEPPPVPQFVDQCRTFITEKTGESATSDRANFYCACVADSALHLSDGWSIDLNASERDAVVSACLSDSYIIYPATNIENH